MSAPSSIHNSVRQLPTAEATKAEHQISLIDTERPAEPVKDAERSNSEATTAPPTPGPGITKRLTSNTLAVQQSLKREWTKRKYARYDRERYNIDEDAAEEDAANLGEAASAPQTSYLDRTRAKANKYLPLKRKRKLGNGRDDEDTVVDILYENQRGFFWFGKPRYSTSTLGPTDPRPWQNGQFRTSPVDIRNAQVPDPSWEWAWKSWYVDMSRDVDEQGWEYSFQFAGNFAWHGSHPWFHSFVRRRRWLRMRRRKQVIQHRTKEKGHEFTAEYFTIHPKMVRRGSGDVSKMAESELARLLRQSEEEAVEKMEIVDIGSLILALKKAAVDREKLVAVRKFVESGGDELFYLSDRMQEIMSLFIFQSSRRQLLTDLLNRYDDTSARQHNLTQHDHEDDSAAAQKDHDAASRHAENLMKAVKAADEQVKKLEYWSDIKSMAQSGSTLEPREGGHWDMEKWQGLSSPKSPETKHPRGLFRSKQEAREGVLDLHPHPEHPEEEEEGAKGKGKENESADEKGKGKENEGAAPRKKSSATWYDAKSKTQTGESSEDTTAAYSTAAESASELPRKDSLKRQKGKGRTGTNLDGVDEKASDDEAETAADTSAESEEAPPSPRLPDISAQRSKSTVQILEPDPEPPEGPGGATALMDAAMGGASGPIKDNMKDAAMDIKGAAEGAKERVKDVITKDGEVEDEESFAGKYYNADNFLAVRKRHGLVVRAHDWKEAEE
ncbi:hypothetical protein LTR37_007775 [Vermiconidia calcicola]|uniref:Uncharacterized protein n=1 Tax=Vermiconidia calcicola TaxID=1690605 RepID=A0ACC3NCJ0_9PEZI|nr:hypothetical protein LTR37_007775 [Vermiconidia calcicola]